MSNNIQINEVIFQKAIEYVLRAPKTERQVRTWLFKKRKEGEYLDIDAIINKLKDLGYINDAEYAARFAEAKQNKYGMRNIKQKLAIKGIAREHVDTLESPDQTELARTLAQKYMRNKELDQKVLQKLYRFLLSKGLSHDTIPPIINELKGGN